MDCMKRWLVFGWDKNGNRLPDRFAYDYTSDGALQRVRKYYGPDYTATQVAPPHGTLPIDWNNLDGKGGLTATPLDWPEGLSEQAKMALDYFGENAYLFKYIGLYVITDGNGYLSKSNRKDALNSRPWAIFGDLNDLDNLLIEFEEDAELTGWLEAVH